MLDLLNARLTELDALKLQLESDLGKPHLDEFQRGMYAGRLIQIAAEAHNLRLLFERLMSN